MNGMLSIYKQKISCPFLDFEVDKSEKAMHARACKALIAYRKIFKNNIVKCPIFLRPVLYLVLKLINKPQRFKRFKKKIISAVFHTN